MWDNGESLSADAMFFEKEHDRAHKCEEKAIWESIFGAEEVDFAMEECTMPPPKVSLKPLPPDHKYVDVEHNCAIIVNH